VPLTLHGAGGCAAPDREAAEAAAVEEFGLDDEQRRRLVVSERDSADR
jgi:hypothetical protein